jgi:hypothetical protein
VQFVNSNGKIIMKNIIYTNMRSIINKISEVGNKLVNLLKQDVWQRAVTSVTVLDRGLVTVKRRLRRFIQGEVPRAMLRCCFILWLGDCFGTDKNCYLGQQKHAV